MARYKRRSIRPIEELPSLFGEELDTPDELVAGIASKQNEPQAEAPADDLSLGESFRKPRKQLKFISFGSGSSGNCSYVGSPTCGLLIDAGVDSAFVVAELARNGIDLQSIRGILLTHDHGDHVRYAYSLARHNKSWKIFATPRTIEGILRRHNLSRRIRDHHTPIYKEHEYVFGDIKVTPFATSHDGTDNLGFSITMDRTTLVIATDTGYITDRADFYLRQATAIMIEANYDAAMLASGRYPEYLKARIRSDIGHMDNVDTASYLAEIFDNKLSHILLCHLSQDNNTPDIALTAVTDALRRAGAHIAESTGHIPAGSVYVAALPRYKSSEFFVL